MKKIIATTLLSVSFMIQSKAQETPIMPNMPVQPGVPSPPMSVSPVVNTPGQNPEIVKFNKIVHDFGNIVQGTPASYTFTFRNVGDRAITLNNVQASCGCTTPNWKGGEYQAGDSGVITATYNAAGSGSFEKNVTVVTSEGTTMLTIKGVVLGVAEFNKWKHEQDSILAANTPKKGAKGKKGVPKKNDAKVKNNNAATSNNKPKATNNKTK